MIRIRDPSRETVIQYGLMVLSGLGCVTAAVAPIEPTQQVALVSVMLGVTVGLWVGHLVQTLQGAVDDVTQING
ncbi:hypothetical protein BRD05_03350 [Halobacteriales archaeon QS_9_70_65]|nr:MAG: hypothetical protein BRD05_03350 [Halobacteriales archaeon QS_9_70_65]